MSSPGSRQDCWRGVAEAGRARADQSPGETPVCAASGSKNWLHSWNPGFCLVGFLEGCEQESRWEDILRNGF